MTAKLTKERIEDLIVWLPSLDRYGIRTWQDLQKICRLALKSLGDSCPCGGIILADSEDCTTPLCNDCYEQICATDRPWRDNGF